MTELTKNWLNEQEQIVTESTLIQIMTKCENVCKTVDHKWKTVNFLTKKRKVCIYFEHPSKHQS